MDAFYDAAHRAVQDRHNTRKLADRLEAAIVHPALSEDDQAFIAATDFFFLPTVDAEGRPTVSYKGGAPGFVRVRDAATLDFPLYDGNGMFLSAGNIEATAEVGLLFIDFATPHRLRVQGAARLVEATAGADLAGAVMPGAVVPGAVMMVRVALSHVFVNCGRYIHRSARIESARHVPDAGGAQPIAAWKRIDLVQDVLAEVDQGAAAAAGVIGLETYDAMRRRGEV